MLSMFRMDVVKVDRDVAYVAMVVHLCCKHMFLMFSLLFHIYVANVLSGCCVCVAMVFQVLHVFFKCFRRMFQTFYLSSDVCCKCCIWMF